MTKLKKTLAVVLATATVAVCALISASADVFTVVTPVVDNGAYNFVITYSDLDDEMDRVIDQTYGTSGFVSLSATDYTVSFSPSNGASTTVQIRDVSGLEIYDTIVVPKYSSGMPSTLTATMTIPANSACAVSMYSNSSTANTSGSFTIKSVGRILY